MEGRVRGGVLTVKRRTACFLPGGVIFTYVTYTIIYTGEVPDAVSRWYRWYQRDTALTGRQKMAVQEGRRGAFVAASKT